MLPHLAMCLKTGLGVLLSEVPRLYTVGCVHVISVLELTWCLGLHDLSPKDHPQMGDRREFRRDRWPGGAFEN